MDKGLRYLFLCAAAAFLALGAYAGAALWDGLGGDIETAKVYFATYTRSVELQGIIVREEQPVFPKDGISAAAGQRLRAKDNPLAAKSALYCDFADGYESLSPALLQGLSPAELEKLLTQAPSPIRGACGRLVYGYTCFFAALTRELIPSGGRCSLLFDGYDEPLPARIIYLSEVQNGSRAAVLRLTEGMDRLLEARLIGAKLIISETAGLELPNAALFDEGGLYYVYTVTAGVVERKAVDIIYTGDEFSLARVINDAAALREGNIVIVSGQDIYEGRVLR